METDTERMEEHKVKKSAQLTPKCVQMGSNSNWKDGGKH